MLIKQISVFIENMPGKLGEVTQVLGENGIDMSALSLADTTDFGILRLIVNDPDKACQVLRNHDFIVKQSDVVAGKDLLKDVYAAAAGRIDIMAGCGVKKWNIQEVHDHTGIVVFHTTGRKGALDSGMKYRKSTVAMGLPTLSEYEIWETDEQEFRECAQIVHSFGK